MESTNKGWTEGERKTRVDVLRNNDIKMAKGLDDLLRLYRHYWIQQRTGPGLKWGRNIQLKIQLIPLSTSNLHEAFHHTCNIFLLLLPLISPVMPFSILNNKAASLCL